MTCTKVQPLLEAFADHDLSALTQWRVRRHLTQCPACTAELAEINALTARVRVWQNVPAPAGLEARIAARLPAAAPVPARPPMRRAAVGLTGLAAALAAAFWLVPGQPGRPTIALADVERAMASVTTVSYIVDTAYYDAQKKVTIYAHQKCWLRRHPAAVAYIPLPGSTAKVAWQLTDARGTMELSNQGKFLHWIYLNRKYYDPPIETTDNQIDQLTRPLVNMAGGRDAFRSNVHLEGQSMIVEGQPALKFVSTMYNGNRKITSTIWVSTQTKRVIQIQYEVKSKTSSIVQTKTNIVYNQTPPPGVFDVVPPPGAAARANE